MNSNFQGLRSELNKQRRQVDFDTYDVTVDELLRRVETKRVDVSPAYQRKFRWDNTRQSTLVESIFLGIPVPPLFMATNIKAGVASSWEVVDGLQRVTTLVNFAGSPTARQNVGLKSNTLTLAGLTKLSSFNDATFEDLPGDLRSLFVDLPMRIVVLNDKSDRRVRFDLFERINTGGITLTHQEVRECVFRGSFIEMLEELAEDRKFLQVVRVAKNNDDDGTREEFVLRFFAYLEKYLEFDHLVKEFLDEYTIARLDEPGIRRRKEIFHSTFEFLAECFPTGIHATRKITPVNLFEGVAVGAGLAIQQNQSIKPLRDLSWINGTGLKPYISGATNTRARVKGRIEYCRDKFLGK